ncbi:MAG UNVERIFIED_CONTAM: hypothetical protein LVR18_13630 [Planctomycetaceae bacterium]
MEQVGVDLIFDPGSYQAVGIPVVHSSGHRMLQTTIRLALMSRQTSAATAAKAAAKTAASRRSSARSLLQAADDGKSHELAQPASLTVSQAARSLLKQELKLLQRQLSNCIDRWRP